MPSATEGYLVAAAIIIFYLAFFIMIALKNRGGETIGLIIMAVPTVYLAIVGTKACISIKKYGDKSPYYLKHEDVTGKTWDETKGDPYGHSTFNTISALNMREKPDISSKVIYVFRRNEGIIIRSPDGERGDWLLAETVNLKHKGFINKNYIRAIDNKEGTRIATKHFFNIVLSSVKGIFSWLGLISAIITVICSIAIYNARGQNERGMEWITSITMAICLIISRRLFYGFENLMLLGMEVATFFFVSYFVGFLIWKIVYFILEEYS